MSYASNAATAKRLIDKYGRSMTLRSQTASGDAWNPAMVDVDTPVIGLMLDYEAHEKDGTVQANDKKVYLSADVSPDTTMKLVDGQEMEIVSVKPLQPGDTLILSELQVRK